VRIAQVAPLAEAVPPKFYGGTERVIWWLTEALVELGHDVTLYASGDSVTSARLVAGVPSGLRLAGINDHIASTLAMLDRVRRDAADYDIIHFHVDFLHFPTFRHLAGKCVTTLHGRLDLPDFWPAFDAFPEVQLVSISESQRGPVSHANFIANIPHGLPPALIEFDPDGGGYLAFVGRISREKRPDRAIEIARRTGKRLKIAAKVDPADKAYFKSVVEPLLDDSLIEFIGEIGDSDKSAFLGGARALLFPIDWPEPFGLVMIEAMAAGTPVIAWRAGATPEVIDHGTSGFLVESLDQAVAAVEAAGQLSRTAVRSAFDARFTVERMARDYVALYESLIAKRSPALFEPTMVNG
jgi:glycosyltransferase involved in cell wall biosynthesis